MLRLKQLFERLKGKVFLVHFLSFFLSSFSIKNSTNIINIGAHTQILSRSTQQVYSDGSDDSDDDLDSFSPSFPSSSSSSSKNPKKSVTMGGVTKPGVGGRPERNSISAFSTPPPSAMKGGRRGSEQFQRSVTEQQVCCCCGYSIA